MEVPTERFAEVARHRPIAVVGTPLVTEEYDAPPASASAATAHVAPAAAIEVDLAAGADHVDLHLTGPDGARLTARLADGVVTLGIATDRATRHRSRRHGRARRPDRLALALTGRHLTALTREQGRWVARARVDLADRLDPHDPAWLGGLVSGWESAGAAVTGWRAGRFGQLGLRDLRLVTHADGTAYRSGGQVYLSATSAGPGPFDTAHASLWRLDPATYEIAHCSDLWFERPDRPGVYGDHACHVVRDGDRWLVATSTWGDFVKPGSADHGKPWVDVTLAETTADLLAGPHVLPTRPLPLPTGDLTSVGVWDPHMVRDGDGWLVGFVSARKYFDFHPVLAGGPDLDRLELLAAATDRTATEGTTLWPTDAGLRVLASDGPDNPRGIRRRYPVLDRDLRETGTLAAPYLTNIGWPTLVPGLDKLDQRSGPYQRGGSSDRSDWLMVTFDGTPYGGRLAGYGTHGDVVVLSPATP